MRIIRRTLAFVIAGIVITFASPGYPQDAGDAAKDEAKKEVLRLLESLDTENGLENLEKFVNELHQKSIDENFERRKAAAGAPNPEWDALNDKVDELLATYPEYSDEALGAAFKDAIQFADTDWKERAPQTFHIVQLWSAGNFADGIKAVEQRLRENPNDFFGNFVKMDYARVYGDRKLWAESAIIILTNAKIVETEHFMRALPLFLTELKVTNKQWRLATKKPTGEALIDRGILGPIYYLYSLEVDGLVLPANE